jgi:hypothetical protein
MNLFRQYEKGLVPQPNLHVLPRERGTSDALALRSTITIAAIEIPKAFFVFLVHDLAPEE